MKGKRVFVSGGAGVIGLEMIPRLIARGAEVMVGDIKPRPHSFPRDVRYRQGDLNGLTKEEIATFSPQIFIHLAATFERSTETYGFWEENFQHNTRLSHHLMSVLKDLRGFERSVFASSYLIYDETRYQFDRRQDTPVALRETDPVLPRNLTGMAKLGHEIELRFLAGFRADAFTSACARIYRGYGCNSRDVISRWVRALLGGEPITVYRPDGLFDYIYAADTAEGLIRLAEKRDVTGIINLGTGRARRVQEIVDILRTYFPDMQAKEAPSDIAFEASQADMTAWKAAIGWMPEYDLERAIPEIIRHEEEKAARATVETPAGGNILVSSASKKVPLIRAVQAAARKLDASCRVIAGDLDAEALSRHVADAFWQMPRTTEEALDALLTGCRERNIRTIIPTRDGELPFWAQHRQLFAKSGIDVVISLPESVETCLDKLAFARFGEANGFPFIPAVLHPDELPAARYVVKERFGAGARSIGLDLARDAALTHGETLSIPIYQPFIEGYEVSIDAWMDEAHEVKGLVLRRRDHVIGGESQITTTFRDARIENVMRDVLSALRLRGPAVLQALVDAEGGVHVIECNTRFGGASTASIAAGLDIFYWSLLEARGDDLSLYPFERVAGEVKQIRLPTDIHVHDSGL